MDIQRRFLTLANGHQVHYRIAGSGPAMVMSHPSPGSSESMVRAMNAFKDAFTCIAIDTPGYGLSDDFVSDPDGLWAYADAVAHVLDAFGLDDAIFYGAATGAQIGVQFARRYPNRTRLLVMDAAGHFSEEELVTFNEGYFVDLTPKRDGTHLISAWDASRHLSIFFPWMSDQIEHRIMGNAGSPAGIQHGVLDMLRAGPDYREAYWAAMQVENYGSASQVTVSTLLAHNVDSIVSSHAEALISQGLPDNFTVIQCDSGNRYALLLEALEPYTDGPACGPPPAQTNGQQKIQNMMVEVPGGQLRARVCFEGDGRPLLAIHGPAESAALIEPALEAYVGKRPVIAFDSPGHGDSDLEFDTMSAELFADVMCEALDTLGIDSVDVLGRFSGGAIGMEMSFQRPSLVAHLAQAGVSFFEGDEQADLIANYTPSITPRWDGGHLLTAWAMVRDRDLYWPWYNQTRDGIILKNAAINVVHIHATVTELLKCGDRYGESYAIMWSYPMADKLAKLDIPCLLCHPSTDPTAYTTHNAHALDPRTLVEELPADMAEWHTVLDGFWG